MTSDCVLRTAVSLLEGWLLSFPVVDDAFVLPIDVLELAGDCALSPPVVSALTDEEAAASSSSSGTKVIWSSAWMVALNACAMHTRCPNNGARAPERTFVSSVSTRLLLLSYKLVMILRRKPLLNNRLCCSCLIEPVTYEKKHKYRLRDRLV